VVSCVNATLTRWLTTFLYFSVTFRRRRVAGRASSSSSVNSKGLTSADKNTFPDYYRRKKKKWVRNQYTHLWTDDVTESLPLLATIAAAPWCRNFIFFDAISIDLLRLVNDGVSTSAIMKKKKTISSTKMSGHIHLRGGTYVRLRGIRSRSVTQAVMGSYKYFPWWTGSWFLVSYTWRSLPTAEVSPTMTTTHSALTCPVSVSSFLTLKW